MMNKITMDVEEAIQVIERILAPERLNSLQELVLRYCWQDKSYQVIADESGYAFDYVRVVGSQLWQRISSVLGEKVTKNNIRSVFRQITSKTFKERFASLEVPDRPVSSSSPFYIDRPDLEEPALYELDRPGVLICIKAPEKFGKTSLMLRLLDRANSLGYKTVRINWQQADTDILNDLDRLLRWFCANITLQLGLKLKLDEFWHEDLGSKVNCTNYLENLLEQINRPLVIGLDEVNRLFENRHTAKDFLFLLRFWHEESSNSLNWQKLKLIVVCATEFHAALDLDRSSCNIGLGVKLTGFNLTQAYQLAERHNLNWIDSDRGEYYLMSLLTMTNGHPYLMRLAFYELARQKIDIEQLLKEAALETGIYSNILRNYLLILQKYPELSKAFKQVIVVDKSTRLYSLAAYKLESMGLITLTGDRVTMSCDLYRTYFSDRLEQF
jgi:AAA-like domain